MLRLGTKLNLRLGWTTLSLVAMGTAAACGSSTSTTPGTSSSGSTSTATSSTASTSSSTTTSSASSSSVSDSGPSCTYVFEFDETNLCSPSFGSTAPALTVQCTLCGYNENSCWFLDAPPPATGDAGDAGDAGAETVDAGGTEVPAPIPCSNPSYTCVYPAMTFVNNGPDAGGDPYSCSDPGYVQFTIPFSGYNQQSDIQYIFNTPQDFSKYTSLYVRYELISGFVTDPNAGGAFEVALKSGTGYNYASTAYSAGQFTAPVPAGGSGWKEVDFDLASPQNLGTTADGGLVTFDDTMVDAVELHFDTGGGPLADAGAGPLPTTAVFNVDMIGLK